MRKDFVARRSSTDKPFHRGNKVNDRPIEVNGVVTTDVKDSKDASGVIGIQHHGEKGKTYKLRNLRIKELK